MFLLLKLLPSLLLVGRPLGGGVVSGCPAEDLWDNELDSDSEGDLR